MGNGSVDGVGNDGSGDSVGNGSVVDLRVGRGSLIGGLSNESKIVVGMVGGGLDSAVRESNGVGSSNVSVVILGFSLSEVSSAVVISYSILVGKGLRGLIVRLGGKRGGGEGGSSGHKSRGKDNLKHDVFLSISKQLPM